MCFLVDLFPLKEKNEQFRISGCVPPIRSPRSQWYDDFSPPKSKSMDVKNAIVQSTACVACSMWVEQWQMYESTYQAYSVNHGHVIPKIPKRWGHLCSWVPPCAWTLRCIRLDLNRTGSSEVWNVCCIALLRYSPLSPFGTALSALRSYLLFNQSEYR